MSTYEDHDARIYGDTTMCAKCGKQWDTNDPEPPPCIEARPPAKPRKERRRNRNGSAWIDKISKEVLHNGRK